VVSETGAALSAIYSCLMVTRSGETEKTVIGKKDKIKKRGVSSLGKGEFANGRP